MAGLAVAVVAMAILILGSGGNEGAVPSSGATLLQEWQSSIGLTTLNCNGTGAEPATGQGCRDAGRHRHQPIPNLQSSSSPGDARSLSGRRRRHGGGYAELEAIDVDRGELALALQGIALFDLDLALTDLTPTPENQSWFLRAVGTFETWGTDFQNWSDSSTAPRGGAGAGGRVERLHGPARDFRGADATAPIGWPPGDAAGVRPSPERRRGHHQDLRQAIAGPRASGWRWSGPSPSHRGAVSEASGALLTPQGDAQPLPARRRFRREVRSRPGNPLCRLKLPRL